MKVFWEGSGEVVGEGFPVSRLMVPDKRFWVGRLWRCAEGNLSDEVLGRLDKVPTRTGYHLS